MPDPTEREAQKEHDLDVMGPAFMKDRILRMLAEDRDVTVMSLAQTAGTWDQWVLIVADERTFMRTVKITINFHERAG